MIEHLNSNYHVRTYSVTSQAAAFKMAKLFDGKYYANGVGYWIVAI